MAKSTIRGILLALLIVSAALAGGLNIDTAEAIEADSVAFEKTTIIEFTNTGDKPINVFRMWLGSDGNFQSFKTEKGWIGDKTPQGVIIFTSDESVMPGESIKFGIKTDGAKPGINWKALTDDEELAIGKTLADDLPPPVDQPGRDQPPETSGILPDSAFRIIPDKPNIGSSIRVTGDNFAPIQEFDLYLDNKKLDSFVTNDVGYFMTTTKIPDDASTDRVNFIVRDSNGNEKTYSLRLGELENLVPENENVPLTITGIDSVVKRGDVLEPYGTAQPDSTVSITITNPQGQEVTEKSVETNAKGEWKVEEFMTVSSEAPLGEYAALINDGREKITKTYEVITDKVILLSAVEKKYEIGDIMRFNGTAIPNTPLEIIIEDPIDQEVFSDVINVGESGYVEIELKTTNDFQEGTYTLFASQDNNLELVYGGLGEVAQIPVNVQFSKLNYAKNEDAHMIITGKSSETVSLLILSQSDKIVGEKIQIKIGPDGRSNHTIDLDGFSSGAYNAVISKGTTQKSTTFTVGLQEGSGPIDINTTKTEYKTGDQILVLGETKSNVLLTLELRDPDGNTIKERESFSNKNGRISNNSFRVPSEASPGTWSIRATSGSNFDIVNFEVTAVNQEGMIVFVEKDSENSDKINIRVIGTSQTVEISIVSPEDEIFKLKGNATDEGEVNMPWEIPKDFEPGIYTVNVTDGIDSAETTFEVE